MVSHLLIKSTIATERVSTVTLNLRRNVACHIYTPPTYNLGRFSIGSTNIEKKLSPFEVSFVCDNYDLLPIHISAEVVDGIVNAQKTGMILRVNNLLKNNNPVVKFEAETNNRTDIVYLGMDYRFCAQAISTNNYASCKITPTITIPQYSDKGDISGSIRFTVIQD